MSTARFNASAEKKVYLILWLLVLSLPVLLSPGKGGIDWNRVFYEWLRILPFLFIFLINNFFLYSFFNSKKYSLYFISAAVLSIFFSLFGAFSFKVIQISGFHSALPPGNFDLLRILESFFFNLILSVLCIGFNDAVKIAIGWFRDRKNFELLQKENIQTQLSLLQQQINPHFFMNTLNNIHALIDYDSEMAKKSVIKLSKLMRVLLYEIEDYTLRKEIDFISDYLELMRIRVNENVEIRYEYPGNIPAVNLPPLLFISFVENSFKHGILANGKSFIHIKFEIKEGFLCVWIANSRHDKHSESPIKEKIGINNSKKRLDLIYGKHYTHIVTESDTSYEVKIKVPLYETPMPGH